MANKKPIVLNGGQREVIQAGDLIDIATLPIDTDGTFAANSDTVIPTQKAVKTYFTANSGGGNNPLMVQIFS